MLGYVAGATVLLKRRGGWRQTMTTGSGGIAVVFPGQGSQFVGMGVALAASPAAADALALADETLAFPLTRLMDEGPAAELEDTINAQPAILAASVAAWLAVQERAGRSGVPFRPLMAAGHSLGEFSALVAAGALAYPEALRLVRERGRLMKAAGEARPGGMAAVLGLDDETLAEVCADASDAGIVVVANANCPGQTVISGEVAALERAMSLAKERGAKRVARLGVSIASHSPLMRDANEAFAQVLDATPIADPEMPVVGNATATPLATAAAIRDELRRQMEQAVLWTRSIETMIAAGTTSFVELGPGNVLAGLIKRIDRGVPVLGSADLTLDPPVSQR